MIAISTKNPVVVVVARTFLSTINVHTGTGRRLSWLSLKRSIGCTTLYNHLSSSARYSSNNTHNSKNRTKNKNKKKKRNTFDLQALPFSISPEEALESFRKWAENDQGLKYLMSYNSIRIGAAYVPVWSFGTNIRFRQQQQQQQKLSWKPPIFSIYDEIAGPKHDVIYVNGLSAYAGYSYRRSLINPVHSTTLLFLGEQTEPFGGWMLNDMMIQDSGHPINVIPDAWNSTQGQSFSIIKEELQEVTDDAWINDEEQNDNNDHNNSPTVQTQVVSARRVFLPTFVIEYKILGLQYKAFVSGCDKSAPVGGVSHRLFDNTDGGWGRLREGFSSPEFHRSSQTVLTRLAGTRIIPTLLSVAWFVMTRLLSLVPVIGAAGGVFTGFRKILLPWMDDWKASAAWERQRQHEAEMMEEDNGHDTTTNKKNNKSQKHTMNDFDDFSGRARTHFNRNKDTILQSLSGDNDREGNFDWYSDWQTWAQQQQQSRQHERHQHRRSKANNKTNSDNDSNTEYKWPFDANDPYSVLDIGRYVTDSEVSAAFRKEMLKYHPDTQPNVSEAHKLRSIERSKLITNAYRTIKTQRKASEGK